LIEDMDDVINKEHFLRDGTHLLQLMEEMSLFMDKNKGTTESQKSKRKQ